MMMPLPFAGADLALTLGILNTVLIVIIIIMVCFVVIVLLNKR